MNVSHDTQDYLDKDEQWYEDHADEFVPAEDLRPSLIEARKLIQVE